MRPSRPLALLAVALGLLTPAIADAHFAKTRWGMTAAQAIAASDGKMTAKPGAPGDRLMGQDQVASGTLTFENRLYLTTYYVGSDGKLSLVRLQPVDIRQCDAIAAELSARYGRSLSPDWLEWTAPDGDGVLFAKGVAPIVPCSFSYRQPGLPAS